MRLALVALALLGTLHAGSVQAQTSACTYVASGANQDITAFSTCRKVTNGASRTVCAVTQVNSTQWASFYTNPPAGVTIASCTATCAGYSYDGYCYYMGLSDDQNCTDRCAGYGGCNLAGTQYIGSAAPDNTRCTAVLNALGYPYTAVNNTAVSNDSGCSYYWRYVRGYEMVEGAFRAYGTATTCEGDTGVGNKRRACACNN